MTMRLIHDREKNTLSEHVLRAIALNGRGKALIKQCRKAPFKICRQDDVTLVKISFSNHIGCTIAVNEKKVRGYFRW